MSERFDPPILLNRDELPELPKKIATRREAAAVLAMPPCGIQWCGVAACLETSNDPVRLRLALATALERYGFLSPSDVSRSRSDRVSFKYLHFPKELRTEGRNLWTAALRSVRSPPTLAAQCNKPGEQRSGRRGDA